MPKLVGEKMVDDSDDNNKKTKIKNNFKDLFHMFYYGLLGFIQDIIFNVDNIGVRKDKELSIPNHLLEHKPFKDELIISLSKDKKEGNASDEDSITPKRESSDNITITKAPESINIKNIPQKQKKKLVNKAIREVNDDDQQEEEEIKVNMVKQPEETPQIDKVPKSKDNTLNMNENKVNQEENKYNININVKETRKDDIKIKGEEEGGLEDFKFNDQKKTI